MHQAKGTFDVKVSPLPADSVAQTTGIGRLQLDKQFHGTLEASGVGLMLASGDGRTFGAYVAIERVEGVLDGRKGGFALVHHARMNEGVPEDWSVAMVPGSGSGELAALSGRMRIDIADGEHRYVFDYALDDAGDG